VGKHRRIAGVELATPEEPMDFSGWFEVYLEPAVADRRPPQPAAMTGRILIARGGDADVAIAASFGPNTLTDFRVWVREQQDT
jgi:hypothetical protein